MPLPTVVNTLHPTADLAPSGRRTPRGIVLPALLPALFLISSDVRAQESSNVVVVEMVDTSPTAFVFEPANITVRPGDVVRFEQTGMTPHNVEFQDPPSGAGIVEILMGPYLVNPGATYEVMIDDRFVAGLYTFVCTPHELMGMKGSITVQAEGS